MATTHAKTNRIAAEWRLFPDYTRLESTTMNLAIKFAVKSGYTDRWTQAA
jgi:hypothetical protein